MIIFRSLCKEVLVTMIATTLILLIIFIINQFVNYLNDAAEGRITVAVVMQVMSLQVPLLVGYLIPLSLFLSLLLTLGRWYADHEMVVLMACGMSRMQLSGMVLSIGIIVSIVVSWLMLSIAPRMEWYHAKIIADAISHISLKKILPGQFQNLGDDNKVFYAGAINKSQKKLSDIFLAERQPGLGKNYWNVVLAQQANEKNSEKEGRFIIFEKGSRYSGIPGSRAFKLTQFEEYGSRLTPPLIGIDQRIQAVPTKNLLKMCSQKNVKAIAEMQWRMAMPISVLLFAGLSIPLSRSSPRKGKFARLLPGILIYLIYANLLFMGREWIEKQVLNTTLGLWWIHALLLLITIVFLSKTTE